MFSPPSFRVGRLVIVLTLIFMVTGLFVQAASAATIDKNDWSDYNGWSSGQSTSGTPQYGINQSNNPNSMDMAVGGSSSVDYQTLVYNSMNPGNFYMCTNVTFYSLATGNYAFGVLGVSSTGAPIPATNASFLKFSGYGSVISCRIVVGSVEYSGASGFVPELGRQYFVEFLYDGSSYVARVDGVTMATKTIGRPSGATKPLFGVVTSASATGREFVTFHDFYYDDSGATQDYTPSGDATFIVTTDNNTPLQYGFNNYTLTVTGYDNESFVTDVYYRITNDMTSWDSVAFQKVGSQWQKSQDAGSNWINCNESEVYAPTVYHSVGGQQGVYCTLWHNSYIIDTTDPCVVDVQINPGGNPSPWPTYSPNATIPAFPTILAPTPGPMPTMPATPNWDPISVTNYVAQCIGVLIQLVVNGFTYLYNLAMYLGETILNLGSWLYTAFGALFAIIGQEFDELIQAMPDVSGVVPQLGSNASIYDQIDDNFMLINTSVNQSFHIVMAPVYGLNDVLVSVNGTTAAARSMANNTSNVYGETLLPLLAGLPLSFQLYGIWRLTLILILQVIGK